MSDSKFKMIAGLGNPGDTYSQTRHNIGFQVLEAIADSASLNFNKTRYDALHTRGKIAGRDVFLVKPQSYMNRSGFPIQKLAAYYKIQAPDLIVVHDEMDLEFGKIKVVQSRGHGGHNGVRSIIDNLGRKDFIRVRVGVGHPGRSGNVTGHVLGGFRPEESADLEDLVKNAADACVSILKFGVTRAMNRVNSRS
ncbi:MAG: aminoacyl-tRNA hydrolase [Desulfobacterales bacterium]|nr:aminoacyl-tRNA hydrolase [Desulfobacterales bacterium]